MSAKLFAVVLLLNFLGATIAADVHSRHVRSTSESSSTMNATRSVVSTVTTEITDFANEATEAIDSLNALVTNLTQEYAALVTEKADELLENVNTAIANAVGDNGTDSVVYECANAQLNNTEQVIANLSSAHAACAASAVEEVTSIGTDLATLVVEALELVETIEEGSAACEALSSVISQATCWTELLVTSAASAATITAQGTALITTITTLQTSIEANLQVCSATSLASAAVAEAKIMANIALCAATSA